MENRVGDSAANPYLYIAAQAAAGLDGILSKTEPGPLSEDPYSEDVPQLPTTLAEAIDALEADTFYREAFGGDFIDYLVTMKRSEVTRYEAWVAENPDTDDVRQRRHGLGAPRVLRTVLAPTAEPSSGAAPAGGTRTPQHRTDR